MEGRWRLGAIWNKRWTWCNEPAGCMAEKAFGGEYIRLMDVGVYPNDGNVAIVTDWYRTMKTIDGGKTWKQYIAARNLMEHLQQMVWMLLPPMVYTLIRSIVII